MAFTVNDPLELPVTYAQANAEVARTALSAKAGFERVCSCLNSLYGLKLPAIGLDYASSRKLYQASETRRWRMQVPLATGWTSDSDYTVQLYIIRDNSDATSTWTIDVDVDDNAGSSLYSASGVNVNSGAASTGNWLDVAQFEAANSTGYVDLTISVNGVSSIGSKTGVYAMRCTPDQTLTALPSVSGGGAYDNGIYPLDLATYAGSERPASSAYLRHAHEMAVNIYKERVGAICTSGFRDRDLSGSTASDVIYYDLNNPPAELFRTDVFQCPRVPEGVTSGTCWIRTGGDATVCSVYVNDTRYAFGGGASVSANSWDSVTITLTPGTQPLMIVGTNKKFPAFSAWFDSAEY